MKRAELVFGFGPVVWLTQKGWFWFLGQSSMRISLPGIPRSSELVTVGFGKNILASFRLSRPSWGPWSAKKRVFSVSGSTGTVTSTSGFMAFYVWA